jgi:phosphate transport system substrate-binding protein
MLKKLTNHLIVGAAFMAIGGLGGAMAAQVTEIAGAGSTFAYPILAKWAETYNRETGLKLNYQSIGSGGGIKQIKAKTVDFGASDAPLTNVELNQAGLMQFPMIIGGVVPVVNLPGIKAGEIKISPTLLADIYLGKITKWNDKAIAALNKGVKLPSKDISVVHRSDGSGTTWIFTNYLTKVSKDWADKVGNSTAVAWPNGVGGKGNEGVASYVSRIKGSIGYVEYAYALQNKMTYVKMQNHDGNFLDPTSENFQAAAANADWAHAPGYYLVLTDQPGKNAWPISGASFALMHTSQAKPEVAQAVLKFFDWSYRHGAKMAEQLDYVPIPMNVVKLVENTWQSEIKGGNGQAVWK